MHGNGTHYPSVTVFYDEWLGQAQSYTGGEMFSSHVFRVFAENVLQMDIESLGLRATVLWTADSFTCRGLQAGGSLYHLFSPLLSDAHRQCVYLCLRK